MVTLESPSTQVLKSSYHSLRSGFLGDHCWNNHIRESKASLISCLTSRINALSKVCHYSNFMTRKMVANGIVMSYLVPDPIVWRLCWVPSYSSSDLAKQSSWTCNKVQLDNTFLCDAPASWMAECSPNDNFPVSDAHLQSQTRQEAFPPPLPDLYCLQCQHQTCPQQWY